MLQFQAARIFYGRSYVRVPAGGLPPHLSRAALASWLVPSSASLLTSRSQAQHAPPSAQTPLPRRLSHLSSRLPSLVWCRVCACASMARGEKPTGSTQAYRHPGVRLSQPPLPVLRDHRCAHSCTGWRWQAWPSRADPDLSLSGLSDHLHFQAQHALISSEDSLSAGLSGALRAG
jgi:hypothetical protein